MPTRRHHRQDGTALFLGLIAIVCVGVFFLTKRFLRDEARSLSQTDPIATTTETSPSSLSFISPADAWSKSEQTSAVVFLDIRPAAEFEQSHVPHSRPINFDTLSSYVPETGKITVIIYSTTQGDLLPQVEEILKRSPEAHFFITGGFEAWQASGWPLISLGTPGSFLDQSKITYLTLDQIPAFKESHKDSTVFLDVRTETEFRSSHVAGAIHIPLAEIEFRSHELPRTKTLLIYGKNTTDAFRAGVRLADLNLYLTRVVDATPSDLEKSGVPFEK